MLFLQEAVATTVKPCCTTTVFRRARALLRKLQDEGLVRAELSKIPVAVTEEEKAAVALFLG